MKEMNWDGLPDVTITDEQRMQALTDYEKGRAKKAKDH